MSPIRRRYATGIIPDQRPTRAKPSSRRESDPELTRQSCVRKVWRASEGWMGVGNSSSAGQPITSTVLPLVRRAKHLNLARSTFRVRFIKLPTLLLRMYVELLLAESDLRCGVHVCRYSGKLHLLMQQLLRKKSNHADLSYKTIGRYDVQSWCITPRLTLLCASG